MVQDFNKILLELENKTKQMMKYATQKAHEGSTVGSSQFVIDSVESELPSPQFFPLKEKSFPFSFSLI